MPRWRRRKNDHASFVIENQTPADANLESSLGTDGWAPSNGASGPPPHPAEEGEWVSIAETKRRPVPRTVTPWFTPSAPVENEAVFAGRASQAQRLLNAIYDKGRHVVLFGERGVGKTSLSLVTATALPEDDWCSIRVSCNADDTFTSLWRRIVGKLAALDGRRLSLEQEEALQSLGSPSDLLAILGDEGERRAVIFIDEFDRIGDPQVSSRMADLIKVLSDERHDITLVVVGVADEASRLVVAHPSVQRALVEIHLPRMTMDELRQVVLKAAGAMDIEVEPRGVDIIAYLSFGLPYFAHLIGLAACRTALEESEAYRIELPHIRKGIEAAAIQMPERLRLAYDAITAAPTRAKTLIAAALAEKDRERFFGMAAFSDTYRTLYGDVDLDRAITQPMTWGPLIEEREYPTMSWRFVDPLFAPFCVLRGLAERRVEEELLLVLFAKYEARFPGATETAFPFFDPDAKQALSPATPGSTTYSRPRRTGPPPPPPLHRKRTAPPPPPPGR